MHTAPHVVDLSGAHAVMVPDWHAFNGHLGMYCGEVKFDGIPRGVDLFILCDNEMRADQVLARLLKSPFMVANEIATARRRIYGPIADRLVAAGHAVVADALGPDCDDERMKALYPPPAGPDLRFAWTPHDRMIRLRCAVLRRNGTTGFDKTILRPGSADPTGDVERAYAKYAKRGPVAIGGLTCHAHVAAKLSRIDAPAAIGLRAWREAMSRAGLSGHHEVPPLRIPAASMRDPGDLEWIEVSGIRDAALIRAKCRYVGGTTIDQTALTLTASLPETMAQGIVGMPLSRLWGDEDLKAFVIDKETASTSKARSYSLSGPALPLPMVDIHEACGHACDADEALASSEFADLRIDAVVAGTLSRMTPADLVHVLRTIQSASDNGSNGRMDVSPWVPGAKGRMWLSLAVNMISYSGADMVDMGDFLKSA